MNLAVIIPWGNDYGPRERLWNQIERRWASYGTPYIVAPDPLFRQPTTTGPRPFSLGRAVNAAVKKASPIYDSFIIFGADHLPDHDAISWAAQRLNVGRRWTLPFQTMTELDETATNDWLNNRPVEWPAPCTPSPVAGIMAFRREAFDTVGGFDERYEGWGYEDVDLLNRMHAQVQPMDVRFFDGSLRCLYHDNGDPNQKRRDFSADNPNVALFNNTWR